MKKIFIILLITFFSFLKAQVCSVYVLEVGQKIKLDGKLDEPCWAMADSIGNLTMVEPDEGRVPSQKTVVRVLATRDRMYIGVRCYDTNPEKIISFSKIRDASLRDEDYIKLVFDTNNDKRTGYIFAVNPSGTRYDALVANFGEGENKDWDAYWDAHTYADESGWTAEIVIPLQNVTFSGDHSWGFNIERKIQRVLEIDRWTGIKRDYKVSHLIHAGKLTGLPDFDLGVGIYSRISGIGDIQKSYGSGNLAKLNYSLDFTKKISSSVTTQLTIHTDFAETEVDARRTNLTRFPLFFPEKRSFFLEGADIFDFGIGLRHELIPFYSRRIGLFEGQKIPIIAGTKINGVIKNTNFGALIVRTDSVKDLVSAANLGVIRVKQNILKESSVGMIATFGSPETGDYPWLLGADFNYQTSSFLGDKNFLTGVWGLFNHSEDTSGDASAFGFKIDYPNDILDMSFTVKRIGKNFDPSLGFVPRRGIVSYRLGADYMPRPKWKWIRQFFFESSFGLVTNLNNQWESYYIFTAPVHFLLESGDRFEFNISPRGENLPEDFEISDGVVIPKGAYHWWRYRLEFESSTRRKLNGQITWWFGSFYNGDLDQIELELNYRPAASLNLEASFEKNIAKLPWGDFTQDLFGSRIQFSLNPKFELSSFIQYDNETRQIGTNTRIRWTFSMLGDLFIVYNHNINKLDAGAWRYDSNQLIIKISYGFWK